VQYTVYNQQYIELRQQNVEQPSPKKIFDEDLHTLLKPWRKQKYEILLMMEANASLEDRKMRQLLSGLEMVDIMGANHGMHSPNTYIMGT